MEDFYFFMDLDCANSLIETANKFFSNDYCIGLKVGRPEKINVPHQAIIENSFYLIDNEPFATELTIKRDGLDPALDGLNMVLEWAEYIIKEKRRGRNVDRVCQEASSDSYPHFAFIYYNSFLENIAAGYSSHGNISCRNYHTHLTPEKAGDFSKAEDFRGFQDMSGGYFFSVHDLVYGSEGFLFIPLNYKRFSEVRSSSDFDSEKNSSLDLASGFEVVGFRARCPWDVGTVPLWDAFDQIAGIKEPVEVIPLVSRLR